MEGPDSFRVSVTVALDNQANELYFEVPVEYAQSLSLDVADAFIVGLIPWAAISGCSLKSELPVSQDLLFRLRTFFLPFYAKFTNTQLVELMAKPVEVKTTASGVATGLSCGIDSLSTIYDFYLNAASETPQISHLTFFDVGSNGDGQKSKELFEYRLANARKCAGKLSLPLITITSNLCQFNKSIRQYENLVYINNIACAILLKRLIGVYYLPSTYSIFEAYHWTRGGERHLDTYEATIIPMLSSHELQLYLTGTISDRIEKTCKVVQVPESRIFLNVCVKEARNCGKCFKCVRTLLTLDLLDVLEEYYEVFDIDDYKNHAQTYWAKAKAAAYRDVFFATLVNARSSRTTSPVWLWYRFRNALKDGERFMRRKIKRRNPQHRTTN